jgi:outer membrane lipoprotein SlyB
MERPTIIKMIVLLICMVTIASCAPRQRMGMVMDRETGLQYGSTVSNNILVDASQFVNRKVKIRIRNTSGDPAFNLHRFRASLERAYAEKGYEPSQRDGFGILLDVNVIYSGQASRNKAREFGLLGASAGGIVGTAKGGGIGAAAGIVTGATLGTVIGSYLSEDTYIVIARVNLAIMKLEPKDDGTTIVFSSSQKKEHRKRKAVRAFLQRLRNQIAVYAGGENTPQAKIAGNVRQRFIRILSDII